MVIRWTAVFVAGIVFCIGGAHGAVIDDFTQGPLSLTAEEYSPGVSEVQTGLADVLDGRRETTVQAGSTSSSATVTIDPADGGSTSLEVDEGNGYLYMLWGSATQPLKDYSDEDRFVLSGVEASGGDSGTTFGSMYFRVHWRDESDGAHSTVQEYSLTAQDDPFDIVMPFEGFAPFGSGPDFARVTQLELEVIRVREGASLRFGDVAVTAVPEPGSLAMLGLAGLALLRRRRSH